MNGLDDALFWYNICNCKAEKYNQQNRKRIGTRFYINEMAAA